jgi:hypothetical protein
MLGDLGDFPGVAGRNLLGVSVVSTSSFMIHSLGVFFSPLDGIVYKYGESEGWLRM